MNFEWNEEKAAANLAKHGVAFDEAKSIFDDPLSIEFYDPDHSEGEDRFIMIGQSAQNRFWLFLTQTATIKFV